MTTFSASAGSGSGLGSEHLDSLLISDPDVRRSYGLDSSIGARAADDFEVVRARDVGDVVEALTYADATDTSVVPQGARTGLCGGAVATQGALVLNVEHLDGIIDIDEVEGIAVLGPGVVNADLKAAVAQHGLFYPPDPASSETCTVGGNVATNAGGLCCVKYGVTADYIRGLELVVPGGEIVRTGRRTAKGVAGMDLTGIVVGSEGTLGVVTQIVAKLVPAPEPALTALATFDSLGDAVDAVLTLRGDPHRPSLLEFLDAPSIDAIQVMGDYGFPSGCTAALLVQSDRPGHTAEDVQRYAELMNSAGATEVAVADDAQEGEVLLAGRRILNAALEVMGHHIKEDMCVPVRRLGELVSGGLAIGERHAVRITMSGHGGDGNLHPMIFIEPDDPDSVARGDAAFDDLIGLALSLGGTIAGEHGIGTLKRPWLEREVGAASLARQRAIKAIFDPKGLMNPGKVY